MSIIRPNSLSVPAGLSIHALGMGEGVAPLELRHLLTLFAMHAILSRESATSVSAAALARASVLAADAALAALSAPPAIPSAPAAPETAG